MPLRDIEDFADLHDDLDLAQCRARQFLRDIERNIGPYLKMPLQRCLEVVAPKSPHFPKINLPATKVFELATNHLHGYVNIYIERLKELQRESLRELNISYGRNELKDYPMVAI